MNAYQKALKERSERKIQDSEAMDAYIKYLERQENNK